MNTSDNFTQKEEQSLVLFWEYLEIFQNSSEMCCKVLSSKVDIFYSERYLQKHETTFIHDIACHGR